MWCLLETWAHHSPNANLLQSFWWTVVQLLQQGWGRLSWSWSDRNSGLIPPKTQLSVSFLLEPFHLPPGPTSRRIQDKMPEWSGYHPPPQTPPQYLCLAPTCCTPLPKKSFSLQHHMSCDTPTFLYSQNGPKDNFCAVLSVRDADSHGVKSSM